jgi:ADP-heptose:LPS heptosyltransferase
MEGLPNRNFRNISNSEFSDLGVKLSNIFTVETIDDLRKTNPNIVIAECVKSVQFKQNNYQYSQELKKNVKYIMALGIYHQLYFDTRINQRILKPSGLKFNKMYKPYIGQDLTDKTLLIWRTGGIGDLLFIQPNLKYLKEKYPTCKIFFACGPQYQSMVKNWKYIDQVIDLPFSLYYMIHSDYHAIFEGVIERTKQAEKENAYRLFTKWLGLNLPDELLIPEQTPNGESVFECQAVLEEWKVKEKDFILIQIRSSSPIRNPNPDVFKKLINELTKKGYNVILTDINQREETLGIYIKTLNNPDKVFNFAPHSKEIADTIALTSLAKLCIATDSALNHIAISLGIKTFGIFGAFTGNIRLETYPENMRDWVDCQSDCSPCFIHSLNHCKNALSGYSKCYNSLDINLCVEKIERLLNV